MKGITGSSGFKALSKEAQTLYGTLLQITDCDCFLKPRAYPFRNCKCEMQELLAGSFLVRFKNGYIVINSEAVREYLLLKNPVIVQDEISEQTQKSKQEDPDCIHANIMHEFARIYNAYPCSIGKSKKTSLNLYYAWLTGKRITIMGEKKIVKYNHIQIAKALELFIEEKADTEEQYIPRLPTFLGERLLCDYIAVSRSAYRELMQRKYGDDWGKVRFVYDRGGV